MVTGKQRIELGNVLVGEVWICSGQSNMEWPLRVVRSRRRISRPRSHPQIRLFTVPKKKARAPVNDVPAKWGLCSPTTVPNFSRGGLLLRTPSLQQGARHVPVGLIHTSWGGSPAEVWMSAGALKANEEYQRDIMAAYATTRRQNYDRALTQWQTAIESERGRSSASWWRRPP